MIELILYSFTVPEQQSFTVTRKLHLPKLSARFGRVFFGQWEDGTLGGQLTRCAHCLAGCQCLGELWVAGGAIVLSPDPVTAKSQRPHAKNCTDME